MPVKHLDILYLVLAQSSHKFNDECWQTNSETFRTCLPLELMQQLSSPASPEICLTGLASRWVNTCVCILEILYPGYAVKFGVCGVDLEWVLVASRRLKNDSIRSMKLVMVMRYYLDNV